MRTFLLLFLASVCASAAIMRDVQYGTASGVSLLMDVSIPPGPGPFPAAILVHGGAWFQGDKSTAFRPMLGPLERAGYAWFSVNYRLAPKHLYPASVEDVETAIRFIRTHAAEFHVDPTRFVLMGESAGGHLAELASSRGKPGAAVEAVVAFYAPSDLVNLAESIKEVPDSVQESAKNSGWGAVLGEALSAISPVQHISKDMPPVLFVHGTKDSLVPFAESTTMCDKMKAAGADCEVIPIEGGDHMMGSWEKLNPSVLRYKAQVIVWVDQELDWHPGRVALGNSFQPR